MRCSRQGGHGNPTDLAPLVVPRSLHLVPKVPKELSHRAGNGKESESGTKAHSGPFNSPSWQQLAQL